MYLEIVTAARSTLYAYRNTLHISLVNDIINISWDLLSQQALRMSWVIYLNTSVFVMNGRFGAIYNVTTYLSLSLHLQQQHTDIFIMV